jgi:soluble P-type ATPase
MLEITIPGCGNLRLRHLVLDYNGTLARDGSLLDGVRERVDALVAHLQVHVLTADTFGGARSELGGVACQFAIIPPGDQTVAKLRYVEQLEPESAVCIGNGRNDHLMLKEAALGIAVLQEEGVAAETLLAADVVAPDILAALDLLIHPLRLKATLRT